eukprot:267454_1
MSGIADIVGGGSNNYFDYVHCGPLALYLNDIGVKNINYFSLDVEGSENAVLQTIDFDKVKIDIWQIESWNRMCHTNCTKRNKFRNFMVNKGYNLVQNFFGRDDLFIHRNSTFCVFILKRIEYIESLETDVTAFNDRYLKRNKNYMKGLCEQPLSFVTNAGRDVIKTPEKFLDWVTTT